MIRYQKTKTARRIKTNRAVTVLFTLIGAAILLVAPIFHIYLPKTNPVVDAYEATLDAKIESIDAKVHDVHASFEKGDIGGDEAYTRIFKELYPERKAQVAENKKLLKQKVDSERIFGWKSWRSFSNGWGQRLPYVIFMVSFTFLFFAFDIKDKLLYWSLILYQLAGYTITGYQQVYSFWPGQDLPLPTYRWIILSVGFIMGVGIIFIMKYYVSKTTAYKRVIQLLNGVLITEIRPYLRHEKVYEEELMWPTLEKVADEL